MHLPIPSERIEPIINLHGIKKSYQIPSGKAPALCGLDLRVDPNEFISVIGKSGAGKSTLVNIITGIDRADDGEIHVAGTAVHRLGEDERARWRGQTLGVVFQFFQLMPSINLIKNVMLPMEFLGLSTPKLRKERAQFLLEQVGLADHAHKRPNEISGGQQQRVAIARALANDPPLIIADEPTGNLDSRTSKEILDLFAGLVDSGKTLVVVTHDREVAMRANRRIQILDGQIWN